MKNEKPFIKRVRALYNSHMGRTHTNTAWLMLEETSKVHLVQPLCSNKVAQSQLPKTMSRQLLNISKDVESTTSLGNICQSLE